MQRVKELDAIRGLASLTIVVYHLWLSQVGLLGAAVDLFFVLSGFLITSILLSHRLNAHFLLSFYVRRALRIWPIYYLSLLVLVVINPLTTTPGPVDGLPWFATFTQNIAYHWSDSATAFIPAFRHTWSVAIEEQFYLFWPALLWLIGRRGIVPATIALIGLAVGTRFLHFNGWILATHCDGLALGALLSHWTLPADGHEQPKQPRYLAWLVTMCLFWLGTALLVRLPFSSWGEAWIMPVQSVRLLSLNVAFVALVGLIAQHHGHRRLGILRNPGLLYLGQISYGLYLYHHIVFMLWDDYAEKLGIGSHVGLDLAKAGVSFGIAVLSWEYVEQPLLSLKRRFRYQQDALELRPEENEVQDLIAPAPAVVDDAAWLAHSLGPTNLGPAEAS